MKSKLKTFRKVWNIFTTVLVTLVVIMAALLVGGRLFGLKTYTVISPSMTPKYPVGSLVYVNPVVPEKIEENDVISFYLSGEGGTSGKTVATHRVIRVDRENQCFYTKGDANETEDNSPVTYDRLIGRVEFCIPVMGYVAVFVQQPPGTYVAIMVGIILFSLVFLVDYLIKDDGEETEETLPEGPKDKGTKADGESASTPEGSGDMPPDAEESAPEAADEKTSETEETASPSPDEVGDTTEG